MKILEVRPECVIVEDNGLVSTRPNSPYYSLKYFHHDGKRIGYIFSDTSYVKETYDDRIFNCWCNGRRLQLRQDLSEKLAIAIKHHREFDITREYEELFKTAYDEQPDWSILDNYLKNIEGVVWTREGYIVYDSFKIDFKGNAWVSSDDGTKDNGLYGVGVIDDKSGRWNSLCIVMQGTGHSYKATEGVLPDQFGNLVPVSAITMTIISKIVFLLNPNLEDIGFTDQLSKSILKRLSNKLEVIQ